MTHHGQCERCSNNHEEMTPIRARVDRRATVSILDLGCIATLRMKGHLVETDPESIRFEQTIRGTL